MPKYKLKNRWLIVASAIGIHISIGSVYAYSVMTIPVKDILELDSSVIKWAFKFAILSLGLSAALLGKWVEKVGPKKSGLTAALFYSIGIAGSGLAIYLNSIIFFFFFYGLIGGIGLGIGYIAPVSTLVKWFPDKRGLATGLAVMGFGFSALIFGPLMQYLFETVGVSNTFFALGIIYFLLMTISSLYLSPPPENYTPYGFKQENIVEDKLEFNKTSAFKSKRFYYILFMMFVNISAGIAIISSASPMMQETLDYSPIQAAAMVGFIGVFNGLGRIFWSSLSDIFGRINIYILFFIFQIIAFYFIAGISTAFYFLVLLFTIITMYGGAFAILPAFLSDLFGTKQLGTILGATLISWGIAGIVGPTIYDLVKAKTNSLETTLSVFSVMFVFALIASLLMKINISRSSLN